MCVYVCTCMYVYVCVCMYVRGERTRMIRVRITERWVFSYKKSYVIFPVKYQIFIFCNCQCCVLKKCQKNARLLKYAKRYFSMPNALKKCQIWVIWHFKCQPGNPGVYVCTRRTNTYDTGENHRAVSEGESQGGKGREGGDWIISLWSGISSRKLQACEYNWFWTILYTALLILFGNYKCSRCFSCVKYLYSLLFSYFYSWYHCFSCSFPT